ncbi:TadE/TadG family type IV pilus assembly protein [Bradyrhizobium sp.]|jgi:Flp pilus assembly protein TadG|uniref:TadE/TadG family type IV pilus assembly protein n=1 Tax=Bradyrhizobium sp. TaxID=376 RepID=UPI002CB5F987|nr:TadE/TadG family type IV pilus assembly protein [Bradyrhizobium sp.]HWX61566.1 TadE/TadG family type IV pilus assembly protein [Bradyrhizobium sp.]
MSSPKDQFSFRKLLRRFRNSRHGSAAVQFAIVAPLFFGLLFAIIEVAMMFFAGQYLETINQNLARLIMTGQAQQSSYSGPADFLNKNLCQSSAPVLFTCSNLYIDVESYSAFQNITINSQIDGSGNFTSGNMQYNPGGPGDIVVVRLFYQWPTFVTGFGFNLANLSNKNVLLTATAALKNEPY